MVYIVVQFHPCSSRQNRLKPLFVSLEERVVLHQNKANLKKLSDLTQ